jgi:uncharacterized protein (DUF983 family)
MNEWEKDWEFPYIMNNGNVIKCTICNKGDLFENWLWFLDEHKNCSIECGEKQNNLERFV